ncbi:BTAD domain-containing putative transcriptional regulator [Kribbella sp. NPDC051770]|uniref:AfsR/SARP family transcriptional regulator n=1 Tax=Kribbella sp. NPDC051770 TaxID=3155413 RepID=UPI00342A6E3D
MADRLRFAVLGPVRAWRGDGELRLGAPQQQAVLSALLLREGVAASPAELIDTLWEHDVPASAEQVLRTYVYRLRKALGPVDGEPAIVSVGSGYLIRTGAENLDLAAFREGVRAAQEMASAGELVGAVARYDEALALWHGTPLAGVPGESVAAQRRHLELQRLGAVEAKVVAQIDLGDHADAEAVLTELIRQFPLNERFRELLMLSLYRHGRQSDALALYRTSQELLSEELGVDPGHGLRTMQERILRADPTLLPGEKPRQPEKRREQAVPVPAQLPADLRGFTGRTDELAAADELLAVDGAVVITGMAGVGKTAFAVHWAHRIADRYPDGQIYLNFRGFDAARPPLTAEEALGAVFDSLGVRPERVPADPDRQAAYLRSLVAGRRMLFVLDNVRDIEQIRPVLPGGDSFVIVTSRHQLRALAVTEGAALIELDVLPAADAVCLLARRIGSERGVEDLAAMEAIVDWCGRLPLAIAVIAARVAVTSHSDLVEILTQLRAEGSPFDALTEVDAVVDVRSVFSWSLKALSPKATDLFRLLALTRSLTWDEHTAASLTGLPITVVRRTLAELLSANLIAAYGPGSYTFHDLTRLYATELAEALPQEERRAAIHRLLDHYVLSGQNAEARLNPTRRPIEPLTPCPGAVVREFNRHDDAWAWFATHREALQSAQALALEEGLDEYVWRVSWLLQTYLARVGHWRQALALEKTALIALERLDAPQLVARTLNSIGRLYSEIAENDAALEHLNRAVDLFLNEADDPEGAASTSINLGSLLADLGRNEESIRANERVLELTTNETLCSKALNGLGIVHVQRGEYRQALELSAAAVRRSRTAGDRYSEGKAYSCLGTAHHELGQYADAVRCLRRSVELFQAIGDDVNRADSLWHLGDSLLAAGDESSARDAWTISAEILARVDPAAAEPVRERLLRLPVTSS